MTKKWYLSKMIWVNILGGVGIVAGQFYPPAQAFIAEHFAASGAIWSLVNVALRLITKEELVQPNNCRAYAPKAIA